MPNPLTINSYGQRFAWSFEYFTNEDNTEGEQIILNSSNLHTYVGQHMDIDMDTRDVIHSFWIPTMRVKQDLLPGRTTEMRFTSIDPEIGYEWASALSPLTVFAEASPESEIVFEDLTDTDEELSIYPNFIEMELVDPDDTLEEQWTQVIVNGEEGYVRTEAINGRYNKFRLICTELCGSGHGDMVTWVFLWENEEAMLNGWMNNAVEALRTPPAGAVDTGRVLLSGGASYGCEGCHALPALGWTAAIGPSLEGIGSRADERADAAGEDVLSGAEYIAQSLRVPNAYVVSGYGAGIMPQFVSEGSGTVMPQEDLIAIVAYLCTQTDNGNAADNDCGLENLTFDEAGVLADPDAVEAELMDISDEYE